MNIYTHSVDPNDFYSIKLASPFVCEYAHYLGVNGELTQGGHARRLVLFPSTPSTYGIPQICLSCHSAVKLPNVQPHAKPGGIHASG